MDIYSFINSKAISDHCRKIAHQFTPLEMAYLVHECDWLNIPQKHEAFREIIAEQPDMEVVERTWTPHFESLHHFLRTYMELENKYLDAFYQEEPNCVYSFEVLYSGDADYTEDDRIYHSFASCYKAVKQDIDELVEYYKRSNIDIRPLDIKVRKQWFNNDGDEQGKYITVCVDYDNNPTEIWDSRAVTSSEDSDILCAFDGLWPEIPTPFQKGDILVARSKRNSDEEPFILDSIPYWDEDGKHAESIANMRENGDSTDLITWVYEQNEEGSVFCDHGPSYLELEYYDRELSGTEKILLAVSSYIKGELSLELLLRAYDILKNEHRANEARDFLSCFWVDDLVKAGLQERGDIGDGQTQSQNSV